MSAAVATKLREAAELEQLCAEAINDLLQSGSLIHAYGAPAWDVCMCRVAAFSRAAARADEDSEQ